MSDRIFCFCPSIVSVRASPNVICLSSVVTFPAAFALTYIQIVTSTQIADIQKRYLPVELNGLSLGGGMGYLASIVGYFYIQSIFAVEEEDEEVG